MKRHPIFFLPILFAIISVLSFSCKHSAPFHGVYAGVKLSLNPLGGGMNKTDIVIWLREDNTFTDQLEKKDWKTAVRGKYELIGSELHLFYSNGDKDTYTVTKNGNLDGGNFVLFRMELDNSIPKGTYQFKFISGSGGLSTGTTYIGSSTTRQINFDGAGNFFSDRESTTVIAGDNIGGGSTTKSDSRGKYSLKDGSLMLNYENGNTTTHSFFASNGDGKSKPMAVLDGSFYFMEEDQTPSQNDEKLPTATEIFQQARQIYGGNAIDKLQTYKVEAAFNGIKLTSYNDIAQDRFRNEMFLKGKLIAIEQIAGDTGWLWKDGKTTTATNGRITEARYNDYTGILGLRKKNAAAFSKGTVEATKEGYLVEFKVESHKFSYTFDRKFNILSDSYQIAGRGQKNTYSDLRVVSGIRMPFKTVTTDGKNTISLSYVNIEINGTLNTTWEKP